MNDPQFPTPNPPKKRGCFFYGCLTLVVLTLVLGIAAFFTVRYALGKVSALVMQYTEAQPAALPKAEMDPADYKKLAERVDQFKQAMEGGKDAGSLTLTAQELNGLIANNPDLRTLKDRLYLTIEGDQVKGQISVPLAELGSVPGMSGLKGRYLNGSATLKVSLNDGALDVRMVSIDVKGAPLPEQFLAGFQGQNLAKDATRDPQTADALRKLESLEIKDGVVVLKSRGTPVQAESPQ